MFERETNDRPPELWYLAQIASILECLPFRVWGKLPPDVLREVKTFLLKFTSGENPEQRNKTPEELAEEATIRSQTMWSAVLRIDSMSGKPARRELPPNVKRKTEAAKGKSLPSPAADSGKEPNPPTKSSKSKVVAHKHAKRPQ